MLSSVAREARRGRHHTEATDGREEDEEEEDTPRKCHQPSAAMRGSRHCWSGVEWRVEFMDLPPEIRLHVADAVLRICSESVGSLYPVVIAGRLLATWRWYPQQAETLWQRTGEVLLAPLVPLLRHGVDDMRGVLPFGADDLRRITEKMRVVSNRRGRIAESWRTPDVNLVEYWGLPIATLPQDEALPQGSDYHHFHHFHLRIMSHLPPHLRMIHGDALPQVEWTPAPGVETSWHGDIRWKIDSVAAMVENPDTRDLNPTDSVCEYGGWHLEHVNTMPAHRLAANMRDLYDQPILPHIVTARPHNGLWDSDFEDDGPHMTICTELMSGPLLDEMADGLLELLEPGEEVAGPCTLYSVRVGWGGLLARVQLLHDGTLVEEREWSGGHEVRNCRPSHIWCVLHDECYLPRLGIGIPRYLVPSVVPERGCLTPGKRLALWGDGNSCTHVPCSPTRGSSSRTPCELGDLAWVLGISAPRTFKDSRIVDTEFLAVMVDESACFAIREFVDTHELSDLKAFFDGNPGKKPLGRSEAVRALQVWYELGDGNRLQDGKKWPTAEVEKRWRRRWRPRQGPPRSIPSLPPTSDQCSSRRSSRRRAHLVSQIMRAAAGSDTEPEPEGGTGECPPDPADLGPPPPSPPTSPPHGPVPAPRLPVLRLPASLPRIALAFLACISPAWSACPACTLGCRSSSVVALLYLPPLVLSADNFDSDDEARSSPHSPVYSPPPDDDHLTSVVPVNSTSAVQMGSHQASTFFLESKSGRAWGGNGARLWYRDEEFVPGPTISWPVNRQELDTHLICTYVQRELDNYGDHEHARLQFRHDIIDADELVRVILKPRQLGNDALVCVYVLEQFRGQLGPAATIDLPRQQDHEVVCFHHRAIPPPGIPAPHLVYTVLASASPEHGVYFGWHVVDGTDDTPTSTTSGVATAPRTFGDEPSSSTDTTTPPATGSKRPRGRRPDGGRSFTRWDRSHQSAIVYLPTHQPALPWAHCGPTVHPIFVPLVLAMTPVPAPSGPPLNAARAAGFRVAQAAALVGQRCFLTADQCVEYEELAVMVAITNSRMDCTLHARARGGPDEGAYSAASEVIKYMSQVHRTCEVVGAPHPPIPRCTCCTRCTLSPCVGTVVKPMIHNSLRLSRCSVSCVGGHTAQRAGTCLVAPLGRWASVRQGWSPG